MNTSRKPTALHWVCATSLALLSACGAPPAAEPTSTPTSPPTATATSTPTPAPTGTPTPTFTPTPEPLALLLRGVVDCWHKLEVNAYQPLELYYGAWASLGRDYAIDAWDKLEVSLIIDGEEVQGEKQPLAASLPQHCGSNADNLYWVYYRADIAGLPVGEHEVEVIFHSEEPIADGGGYTYGPGDFLISSFTISASLAVLAPTVLRLTGNPIISPDMLPGEEGTDINGPSLIRVPDWVEQPLGKYYLYFAHHIGTYIRMAYADDLAGPWTIYAEGTLHLEDTACNDITGSVYLQYKHVASPDVHVDDEAQQIRMYFHCPLYLSGPRDQDDSHAQLSLAATSSDGLNFEATAEPLGNPYLRVFQWDGQYYAIGMPGVFYRSRDGLAGFEQGPTLFSEDMRHSAVLVQDGKLLVFYTMVGDTPERILLSMIDLQPDWMAWRASEPVVVLEPELDWEGADLPLAASVRGMSGERVRQLRDPAIFVEDGHVYLLYSVAGESGIAIAELHWR